MKYTTLSLKKVGLQIIGARRKILDDVNLNLLSGESVVVLGRNGSGKSSLIKLMNQQYALTEGDIIFNQKSITTLSREEFHRSIITLAQDPAQSLFYDLTVLENCILAESRFNRKQSGFFKLSTQPEKKFFAHYLKDFHCQLSNHLYTEVALLSGGEKQALMLALSVLRPPQLLLLDEHTSALDPHQAKKLMQSTQKVIQKHGITTLMTTHNLDHALEFGDHLIALKEGKIVFRVDAAGKKNLTKEDLLEFCY